MWPLLPLFRFQSLLRCVFLQIAEILSVLSHPSCFFTHVFICSLVFCVNRFKTPIGAPKQFLFFYSRVSQSRTIRENKLLGKSLFPELFTPPWSPFPAAFSPVIASPLPTEPQPVAPHSAAALPMALPSSSIDSKLDSKPYGCYSSTTPLPSPPFVVFISLRFPKFRFIPCGPCLWQGVNLAAQHLLYLQKPFPVGTVTASVLSGRQDTSLALLFSVLSCTMTDLSDSI